jgi:hypothetical protein
MLAKMDTQAFRTCATKTQCWVHEKENGGREVIARVYYYIAESG